MPSYVNWNLPAPRTGLQDLLGQVDLESAVDTYLKIKQEKEKKEEKVREKEERKKELETFLEIAQGGQRQSPQIPQIPQPYRDINQVQQTPRGIEVPEEAQRGMVTPQAPATVQQQFQPSFSFGPSGVTTSLRPQTPQPWKPQTREEQLEFKEDVEAVKTKGQEERKKTKQQQDIKFAVDSVKNLMVPMVKAFKSMKKVTGSAGRLAGIANVAGGITGLNPEVKPFEGQKLEVAAALARIAMPGIRSERAIKTFLKTLPNEFSTDEEAKNQIRNSINNAAARGYAALGLPYDEKAQIETKEIVNSILKEGGYGESETVGTLTKDIAMQILQEAGGDKDAAREIARQRGYEF